MPPHNSRIIVLETGQALFAALPGVTTAMQKKAHFGSSKLDVSIRSPPAFSLKVSAERTDCVHRL